MRIADILRAKGSEVVTVGADRTVLEAIRVLVHHNIGSAVIAEEGQPLGIVTERDVLRLVASEPERVRTMKVADAMTTGLVTSTSEDTVKHAMNLMTRCRVRHLPIVEDDQLMGMVSIGDVVNALRVDTEEVNSHLRAYISGVS